MAVWKMEDKPRSDPWRAKYKGEVANFPTKEDAEEWELEQKRNWSRMKHGLPRISKTQEKEPFGKLVKKYLDEVTPTKASHAEETLRLNNLLKRDICKLPCWSIKRQDAIKLRDDRLKDKNQLGEPIKGATVRREFNTINNIWTKATVDWGYELPSNPFKAIPIKGDKDRRTRRLKPGELQKIEQACLRTGTDSRTRILLAVYLAIETGMRLQEIINLRWEDVSIPNRRIHIRKSKTDHKKQFKGRTIVLTCRAMYRLDQLMFGDGSLYTDTEEELQSKGMNNKAFIFPTNIKTFKQARNLVFKEACGNDRPTFHDLRHEAASRWAEIKPRLDAIEVDIMLGEIPKTMSESYIHRNEVWMLQDIQDKLDRQTLGMTLSEAVEKRLDERWQETLQDLLAKHPYRPLGEPDQTERSEPNVVPFSKAG
jgi:integrase